MRMERRGVDEQIGTPWVIAILALVALLVIGMALYFRMSVRIQRPGRRGAATPAVSRSIAGFHAAQHVFPRDWV